MTHPTREDWMSYVYDELPLESRSAMRAHLSSCPACREQVETWQRASRSLDGFQLPRRQKPLRKAVLIRWAVAAAFVGLAAVGAMRGSALQREVTQMQAAMQGSFQRDIEAAVRLELSEKMRADLGTALNELRAQANGTSNVEAQALITALSQRLETQRIADQQATLAVLQKLNTQHARDYAALRKELETVAIFTEAGLQTAQNQIATLAYSPITDSNKN